MTDCEKFENWLENEVPLSLREHPKAEKFLELAWMNGLNEAKQGENQND